LPSLVYKGSRMIAALAAATSPRSRRRDGQGDVDVRDVSGDVSVTAPGGANVKCEVFRFVAIWESTEVAPRL